MNAIKVAIILLRALSGGGNCIRGRRKEPVSVVVVQGSQLNVEALKLTRRDVIRLPVAR
jgi:hypothetical protein